MYQVFQVFARLDCLLSTISGDLKIIMIRTTTIIKMNIILIFIMIILVIKIKINVGGFFHSYLNKKSRLCSNIRQGHSEFILGDVLPLLSNLPFTNTFSHGHAIFIPFARGDHICCIINKFQHTIACKGSFCCCSSQKVCSNN